jgi:hypothetical protein
MIPSVVQLSTVWFLPESPRWLVSKDRYDGALDVLKKYHGDGEESELVKLEYAEIRAAILQEKSPFDPFSNSTISASADLNQPRKQRPGNPWSPPAGTATDSSSSSAWAS